MAAEQIKELIEESKKPAASQIPEEIARVPDICVESPEIANLVEPTKPTDQAASAILSAPPDIEPIPAGTSHVLKTRKQLISKIKEVCESRGTDHKPMNLARRRKNSLKGILQEQFAEAAQKQVDPEHEIHEGLEGILPEGMEARTKFAVDMAFRLDLTLCKVLEKGISWSDSWHGLSADGFAESIEENQTLSTEIKNCWLEIIMEPDNEWVLECVSATNRLLLCHGYGLLGILKSKDINKNGVKRTHQPRRPKEEAMRDVGPELSTGKLRNLARLKQTRRQDDVTAVPVPPRAGSVVFEV